MQVKVRKEAGYDEALLGMSLSFKDRALPTDEWWEGQRDKAIKRAGLLAGKGGGHDKFLRQIMLWLDIEAPRCWWSEFDTYKVGTVAQSESTMHTLSKRPPTIEDFAPGTPIEAIYAFLGVWKITKDITALKAALPEGFLQRRIVTLNYENLRNIVHQREGHRLRYWRDFIDAVIEQVEHPEFLV